MVELAGSILAQVEMTDKFLGILGAALGCGITVFGAALGIGKIAASATEAIARQPEAGGRIFTSMLLAAALIEGVALFALLVCFLAMRKV